MSEAFPARRVYGGLAVAVMAFAIYASLVPFDLRPLPLAAAWAEFRTVLFEPTPGPISRTNFVANILLFVPVGFGLAGAMLVDRPPRPAAILAALAIVPVSIAVSLAAEFLQLFAPDRVASRTDVVAQTIGCLTGIGAWAAIGPDLTRWLRSASSGTRADRLTKALAAYGVAWIFVNLAPFDITLELDQLGRRLRTGLITIVPFAQAGRPMSRLVWDAFASTLSAAPLGMLGLVGWKSRAARRSTGAAFALGATLVASVEVAQVFIRSHAADVTDIIFGWLGVAIGVWVGARVARRTIDLPASQVVSGWAIAALGLWCLVLCGYHWLPYDFTMDTAAIQRKLGVMSLVPFAGYRSGSDLNAFNNVLVKIGLAIPLGVIAASVLRPHMGARMLFAGWGIVAACVFGAIEVGQLFLPSRTPDPTDVLVGIVASSVGLVLGRWLQTGHGTSS